MSDDRAISAITASAITASAITASVTTASATDTAISENTISEDTGAGYVISAPWRSSGKTLITIGMARAAKRRSIAVQTFKKGPDYIDPLWLAAASGSGCYNLDPYVQCRDEWLETFRRHTHSHTLALVEGTMGLHDGLCSEGTDSNAAIAAALGLPVILVVDCRGMHRSVAALINGILQFDPNTRFAGVILNRIRSGRHESKIRAAIDRYCDTRIVGVVPETRSIHIDEQELGLTPAPEFGQISADHQTGNDQSTAQKVNDCTTHSCIDAAADLLAENCDLDYLFSNLQSGSVESSAPATISLRQAASAVHESTLKIGLAKDQAFHFYYQDDLDTLRDKGIRLIELSPMRDEMPADLDGLIIGGGFPERHAQALTGNKRFREALRHYISNGLVVHAECAGLMYLCRSLILDSGNFDMVGCIAADVSMGKKPVGRGYVQLQRCEERTHGKDREVNQSVICAHEFHHSHICFDSPQKFNYRVLRGYGIDGKNDGVVVENAQASYAHFRHTHANPYLDKFVQRVIDARQKRLSTEVALASVNN